MSDDLHVHKLPWWKALARNAALQIAGRATMFMSLLLCGFIAATITTYSEGLANMVVRQSAVEQTLSLFPDVRMKLEDLAKRMTASEARGDVARADREKQSQQLQRIIDQNIQILTALATQGEKINGVDNRLVRIENKGN